MVTPIVLLALACLLLSLSVVTPDPHGMNVTMCSFTPTGGTATPITGVKTATINQNPQELRDGADGDFFDTFGGVISGAPEVALNLNKPFLLDGVAPGTYGVLTFTANSFINKAVVGGGGVVYTLNNCYFMPGNATHGHRQISTKDVTFKGMSVDGTTSPLAATAA